MVQVHGHWSLPQGRAKGNGREFFGKAYYTSKLSTPLGDSCSILLISSAFDDETESPRSQPGQVHLLTLASLVHLFLDQIIHPTAVSQINCQLS